MRVSLGEVFEGGVARPRENCNDDKGSRVPKDVADGRVCSFIRPSSSCPSSSSTRVERLSSALARSSAKVSMLGGSSRICSQPTGGEPGGEMRKFLSVSGTGRWSRYRRFRSISRGVGSPRYTRSVALWEIRVRPNSSVMLGEREPTRGNPPAAQKEGGVAPRRGGPREKARVRGNGQTEAHLDLLESEGWKPSTRV